MLCAAGLSCLVIWGGEGEEQTLQRVALVQLSLLPSSGLAVLSPSTAHALSCRLGNSLSCQNVADLQVPGQPQVGLNCCTPPNAPAEPHQPATATRLPREEDEAGQREFEGFEGLAAEIRRQEKRGIPRSRVSAWPGHDQAVILGAIRSLQRHQRNQLGETASMGLPIVDIA